MRKLEQDLLALADRWEGEASIHQRRPCGSDLIHGLWIGASMELKVSAKRLRQMVYDNIAQEPPSESAPGPLAPASIAERLTAYASKDT